MSECKDLNLICASQQFRGRYLENCKVSLFCGTTPSIESVKNLQITCYCFNYVHLKGNNYVLKTIYTFKELINKILI